MSGNPGPLVRRRQLGAALRRHRVDAGLSLTEVAGALLLSASKISRIETAQRNISARDVRDLLDLYRVTDPEVRGELMKLVEESRERAWWKEYDLDPGYERLIGLEGAASVISDYQIGAVPGLLQTPEYATAVATFWSDNPAAVKSSVEVRMARQRSLSRKTALNFVVDEGALRRPIGGPDVMREQIQKLIKVSAEPRIVFQAIPLSVGLHHGLVSGFIVLQFPEPSSVDPAAAVSDIVYHEGVVGAGWYLEQPADVEGYLNAFKGLQQKALTPHATKSFLEEILQDL